MKELQTKTEQKEIVQTISMACTNPCSHVKCELSRNIAKQRCLICNMPIGYFNNFVDLEYALVHNVCYKKNF